jgi:nucleoside-diphosphate-sugar epimerase
MEASLVTAKNLVSSFKDESNSPSFIHTSSGAVYGVHPIGIAPQFFRTRTNLIDKPTNFLEEYQNAKIKTEEFVERSHISGKILGINARLFAFYGPHLSTNSHYAIGNFIQSALTKKIVEVKSKGESYRSYMHASELACQLIYLMSNSNSVNCDIGSDFSKSISWWANYIGELFDSKVQILGELEEIPTFYVPNTNFEIPKLDYARNNMDVLFIQWFDWLKHNTQ